ncbi:hypothetical protein AB0L97_37175 [Nocardia sp. NPDC051911]|uniref:hypothetical protein n=1 Tax=Nocardia sp. NPDC051911 TaxID=3154648 RepID=UPI00341F7FF9
MRDGYDRAEADDTGWLQRPTAGQVATMIVDTELDGVDVPVPVAWLGSDATLLRGRLYRNTDVVRDIWEVADSSAISSSGDQVIARGPAGPVRIILSISDEPPDAGPELQDRPRSQAVRRIAAPADRRKDL